MGKIKSLSILVTALFIGLNGCSEQKKSKLNQTISIVPESKDRHSLTTVYINADIITVNDTQPSAQAIAVRDGLIVAIGNRAKVEANAGSHTVIRDLQGQTLLPGFIDAHGHLSYTNQLFVSSNLSSPPVGTATNIEDIITLLKKHRLKYPEASWLTGWGYDDSLLQEQRHPTREDLDKISTDIPILLVHVSGHLVTCNSRCLELAEINASTKNPAGGVIRRINGSNEPNGVLEEKAAMIAQLKLPRLSQSQQLELLDSTQQYYASYGVTTLQDGAASANELKLFKAASEQSLLYLDVVAFPYAPIIGSKLDQYPPSASYNAHFRIGGIKLVLDGSPQGKTAWLTQPYYHPPQGQNSDYLGYPILTKEQLATFYDYAFSNNVQLIAHANGDAAADQMINAVRIANQKYGKSDRRSVMIHAQTVREDQIDSMLQEGILPSYFSVHTFYWGDWHRDSVLGKHRASRISPLRSTTNKGLTYTIHNDTPIVPPDMMRLLWSSVNRETRSGKVLGHDQKATVLEGIKAMTINAAFQYFEEDSKGSLEVGKIADLVILNKNPLKVDKANIKDITVLETIKNGQTVFKL